jgi:hypothetical protein
LFDSFNPFKEFSMSSTLRKRVGDALVTVTVETEPAVVDYADILAATEVVPDEASTDAPWENCDGWGHHTIRARDCEGDASNRQGYAVPDRGGAVVIVLDIPDDNLNNGYPGASKQVRAEALAQSKRDALAQLVKWYSNGWEWWGVQCEFKGKEESLWGIDDYDYADDYVRHEIAGQVASALEEDGYEVVNRPPRENHRLAEMRRKFDRMMGRAK